jgi:pectinesterase inhibitor-like protein
VDIQATCAKTQHPIYCTAVLSADSEAKTAPTVRALAEVAIKTSARLGAAVGSYARRELDLVKDNFLWTCLDECAQDIEDALAHLDDSEGEVDDKQFDLVAQYLKLCEDDTWSCDESCRDTPPSPVKTTVLAKNNEFEKMMNVTNALIKLVQAGANPATPLPAKPATPLPAKPATPLPTKPATPLPTKPVTPLPAKP